jgi:hypothetical protein
MSTPARSFEERLFSIECELEDTRAEREALFAAFSRVCVLAGFADPAAPAEAPDPAPPRAPFPGSGLAAVLQFPGRRPA